MGDSHFDSEVDTFLKAKFAITKKGTSEISSSIVKELTI